jgi:guanylate kinase
MTRMFRGCAGATLGNEFRGCAARPPAVTCNPFGVKTDGVLPRRGLITEPGVAQRTPGNEMHGPLLIVSGPSGSGKSTVVARLREICTDPPLHVSVSATTRQPREGEENDVHYHFWTREQFEGGLDAGAFLESAMFVNGHYYGTPRDEVDPWREKGWGVVLVIDVQGAEQVRRNCPDAVSVFLSPPSMEELERRLRGRGTEDEASIQRRLEAARREMARRGEFKHQIVNDDVEATAAELCKILRTRAGRNDP